MGWEAGRDTNDFVKNENPTKENGMHNENRRVASQRQNGDVYMRDGRESVSMGRSDQRITGRTRVRRHAEEEGGRRTILGCSSTDKTMHWLEREREREMMYTYTYPPCHSR